MQMTRPLKVKGKPVGAGKEPLVCAPLVGRDEATIGGELATIMAKAPDLLEWRVDFFTGIAEPARVLSMAREIRARAAAAPIIFTCRSAREGGQAIAISEEQVLDVYATVCRAGCVDFIDWELSSGTTRFAQALTLARETDTQLIGSFHDFNATPAAAQILAKLEAMQAAGADVAKVAVMPRELKDVLALLEATLEARQRLTVPLITMAMGPFGSLSRMFGWVFGSTVSFAVGQKASAPGQVPIEDLRLVLDVLHRALAPRQ
jgi:3-dehydroquinate dehydratase-1